jgi:hypothetical protein
MIRNIYTIVDKIAYLHITRRNGDKFDIPMNANDLDKLEKVDRSVHVSWHSAIQGYYAEVCDYLGTFDGKPKYKTLLLHRILTEADKNTHVDHINHDTLDNRKENLRVTEVKDNLTHRKSRNSNNKSGYRNVSWNSYYGKWVVQLQIDGKNTILDYFDDVHEAGKFAEEMRLKYYKEYKGYT